MPIRDVKGQKIACRTILNFLRAGRIPHAMLFRGPSGSGKRTTAIALAQAANCRQERDGVDACGECPVCRRIRKGIDLDVLIYKPSRVGYVKEQAVEIRNEAITTPNTGNKKFLILEEADKIMPVAANLLLKIFEEPPANTVFIFLTRNDHLLLPTIRSRAISIPFRPVSIADATEIAAGRLSADQVSFLHPIARGDLGLTFKLAEDENTKAVFTELKGILEKITAGAPDVSPNVLATQFIELAPRISFRTKDDSDSTAERKSLVFLLEVILTYADIEFQSEALQAGTGAKQRSEIRKTARLMELILETIASIKGGGHKVLAFETLAIESRIALTA